MIIFLWLIITGFLTLTLWLIITGFLTLTGMNIVLYFMIKRNTQDILKMYVALLTKGKDSDVVDK